MELEPGTERGAARRRRTGSVTSRPADDDEQGREGSLEWSWDWTRGGVSGWTWDWNRQLKLSCASCIWIWNWSWSWTGQPVSGEQAPGADDCAFGAPGQLNAVSAQATATASSQVAQTVVQDGSGGVDAVRRATRRRRPGRPRSRDCAADWTSPLSRGTAERGRSNTVTSIAGTTLAGDLGQRIEQLVVAADAGTRGPVGRPAGGARAARQRGRVVGAAPRAGDGNRHARSGERGVHGRLREGHAGAPAGCAFRWRHRLAVGRTARARRAGGERCDDREAGGEQPGPERTVGLAIASAHAGDLAVVAQGAEQSTARTGGTSAQTAEQLAFAGQDATARASTDQQAAAAVGRRPGAGRWR